jgi:hypothetical protein
MAKDDRPAKRPRRNLAAQFGAEKYATSLLVGTPMATNIKKIAKVMGAELLGRIPETGGGAFGAAHMAEIVTELRHRLKPGRGLRPGRPTNPNWARHPKVPMSDQTMRILRRLANESSTPDRKVSPMQVAAHLLEEAVTNCSQD